MRTVLSLIFAAGLVAAAPASATDFSLAMTNAGKSGSSDAARTYSQTVAGQTLNVKVTAWTNFFGVVDRSAVGSYGTAGLGITNAIENGANGSHQADSFLGTDFFILQFDQAVKLTSAVFNTYDLYNTQPDNNAVIGWGNTGSAWTSTLPLDGALFASVANSLNGMAMSYGNGSDGVRALSLGNAAVGNVWMISATAPDGGKLTDAFKLAGVGVSTVAAVPEPATWAMMLVGFAMVGAASRYRRRGTATVYA